MIEWHDVESSHINRLGYDMENETAYAEFKNRRGEVTNTFAYPGMAKDKFNDWLESDSPGRYFHGYVENVYTGAHRVDLSAGGGR
jgi:hypothetical protein